MTFSIVIITLNEEKNIVRILNNLKKQTFQNFEVIIVDSNSSDNTYINALELKNDFKKFYFIKMEKRGVALGRNIGVINAKHENILFFDADTTFDNDFLEKISSDLDGNNYEIATGLIKTKDKGFIYSLGCFIINKGIIVSKYFSPTGIGACMFFKKYIYENIGGFDESISLCEDCEIIKRAKKNGYKNGVFNEKFYFDLRRLKQDGLIRTYFKYL